MKQSVSAESEQSTRQLHKGTGDKFYASSTQGIVNNRPDRILQRKLIETISSSPKMMAQCKMLESMQNSPYKVVQRKQLNSVRSSSAQLWTESVKASLHSESTKKPMKDTQVKNVFQTKKIDADLGELNGGQEMGGTYDLKVAGGAKGEKIAYPYLEYDYGDEEVETKHMAMMKMQQGLTRIGAVAKHEKMTNNVNKATQKTQNKTEWTNPLNDQGYYPQKTDNYWPFAVDIAYTYKHKSNRDKTFGDVAVSAFYAPGKYGYITEVMSNNDAYDIKINEPVERLQLHVPKHEDYGEYSSEHSIGGKEDLTQAGIHMTDSEGADAWTKIVAEGARWDAVKRLTEKSLLTNTSKFYTSVEKSGRAIQPDEDINPPYIQFQDLWTKWRVWKNKWGITNAELANELNEGLEDSKNDLNLTALASDTHNLDVGV